MSMVTHDIVVDFSDWSSEQCFIECDGKTFFVQYWDYEPDNGSPAVMRTETFTNIHDALRCVLEDIKYQENLHRQIADAEMFR